MKQVEGKAFVGFHDCLVEHMTQIRNLLLGQPPILPLSIYLSHGMSSLAAGHDFAASIHFI